MHLACFLDGPPLFQTEFQGHLPLTSNPLWSRTSGASKNGRMNFARRFIHLIRQTTRGPKNQLFKQHLLPHYFLALSEHLKFWCKRCPLAGSDQKQSQSTFQTKVQVIGSHFHASAKVTSCWATGCPRGRSQEKQPLKMDLRSAGATWGNLGQLHP